MAVVLKDVMDELPLQPSFRQYRTLSALLRVNHVGSEPQSSDFDRVVSLPPSTFRSSVVTAWSLYDVAYRKTADDGAAAARSSDRRLPRNMMGCLSV